MKKTTENTDANIERFLNTVGTSMKNYEMPSNRAVMRQVMSEIMSEAHNSAIPAFIPELSELINTQDNRITADPLFCVFEKRTIVVAEGYDHDRIVWVDDEGNEADDIQSELLTNIRDDTENDFWLEDVIILHDEDEDDSMEWRRLAIKEVDEFVTACFTDQGCKDFLAIQGHNLRKPFIYVVSLFRNKEMIQLRDWMMGLSRKDTL